MFKKIVLHQNPDDIGALDLGTLAEAMLFYNKVELILTRSNLPNIIKGIGADLFFGMIEEGRLKASYFVDHYVTFSENGPNGANHKFCFMSPLGQSRALKRRNQSGKPLSNEESIKFHLEDLSLFCQIPTHKRKWFVRKIYSILDPKSMQSFLTEGNYPDYADDELNDSKFVSKAAKLIIENFLPSFTRGKDIRVEVQGNGKGFSLKSNIEFETIDKLIKETGLDMTFSPGYIATNIFSAKTEMILGAKFGSGYSASKLSSNLINLKFQRIFEKVSKEKAQQIKFLNVTLNGSDVRSVINSEQKSFGDFLKILEKADHFRKFIHEIGEDQNLMQAYLDDLSGLPSAEKFKKKVLRFGITTGLSALPGFLIAGPVGGAIGLGVSVADAFVYDKITEGWQPSTFINKELKPFVESSENK